MIIVVTVTTIYKGESHYYVQWNISYSMLQSKYIFHSKQFSSINFYCPITIIISSINVKFHITIISLEGKFQTTFYFVLHHSLQKFLSLLLHNNRNQQQEYQVFQRINTLWFNCRRRSPLCHFSFLAWFGLLEIKANHIFY